MKDIDKKDGDIGRPTWERGRRHPQTVGGQIVIEDSYDMKGRRERKVVCGIARAAGIPSRMDLVNAKGGEKRITLGFACGHFILETKRCSQMPSNCPNGELVKFRMGFGKLN